MGSRSPTRDIRYWLLPPALSDRPAESLGDAMIKGEYVVLRCQACHHVAVLRPEVLAQLLGWDARLAGLPRRLKCTRCGARHKVRVETTRPGDR
jgi:hypothetical protein